MAPAATPKRLTHFDVVEHLQGGSPWGSVLDAGTGIQSARWMSGLSSASWTAVSADADHLAATRDAVAAAMRPQDRLVQGNWRDERLLEGEQFDTVFAEYLLGAIEGYAPYFQGSLFSRLRPMVRGRIYVIGIDPYVTGPADSDGADMVQKIGRFRDGCALLAGVTPYREFPAEWVLEQLARVGLRVVFARRFPNIYDMRWVDRQFRDVELLIEPMADRDLARALAAQAMLLRSKADELCARQGGLPHGHDYVIAAEAH